MNSGLVVLYLMAAFTFGFVSCAVVSIKPSDIEQAEKIARESGRLDGWEQCIKGEKL